MKLGISRTSGALFFALAALLSGCGTRHWAAVEKSQLPPPPGDRVLHTDRIVIHVTDKSGTAQCVAYERYHPVCFHSISAALEHGLLRSLWPSYPEVVVGTPKDARPSDYLLQVEVTLDALPPDDAGPGWSAGARSRFRVMREGKIIAEETLASRSRAQFPYGSPLGEGATEVIDATILHVASAVSRLPEARPDEPKPLPVVASRDMTPTERSKPKADTASNENPSAVPEKNAKSDPPAKATPSPQE
jgi:hypothetical protein